MEILLIRHGQAVDEAPGLGDAGRWLTPKGRKITRKVARWVAKSDKRRPATIWTSPLVRAVQTAEILAAEVGYRGELRCSVQLSPGHDPGDLIKLLGSEAFEGPLALVGHEPSLSLIANALLGDIGLTGLRKSSVLGLSWADGQGTFRFVLDPATMKAIKRITPRAEAPAAGTNGNGGAAAAGVSSNGTRSEP
jgi:phosphohistidine phosphatase